MDYYIHAINLYLSENQLTSDCPDINSLLDRFYCCYRQTAKPDPVHIREQFKALDDILSKPSIKEGDQVVDITCSLCNEIAHNSFCDGILLCFRLYNELHTAQT